jgi:hypothetical protein
MSKLTTEIKNLIIKKRSHLSPQSVKTYTSILSNLYKNIFGLNYDESNFDNTKKILEYLNGLEPNKRKTILSALVIIKVVIKVLVSYCSSLTITVIVTSPAFNTIISFSNKPLKLFVKFGMTI